MTDYLLTTVFHKKDSRRFHLREFEFELINVNLEVRPHNNTMERIFDVRNFIGILTWVPWCTFNTQINCLNMPCIGVPKFSRRMLRSRLEALTAPNKNSIGVAGPDFSALLNLNFFQTKWYFLATMYVCSMKIVEYTTYIYIASLYF